VLKGKGSHVKLVTVHSVYVKPVARTFSQNPG
jgi:hypothetical protein